MKPLRMVSAVCLLGAATACSSTSGAPNEPLPPGLTAAGVDRVERTSTGADVLWSASGVRLGEAIAVARDGQNEIRLDWQGRTTTMRWSATKLDYACDGANVTFDATSGARSGTMTDDCRTPADITDALSSFHKMPSPLGIVVAKGDIHTQEDAFMLEQSSCTDYTDVGYTSSSACSNAFYDGWNWGASGQTAQVVAVSCGWLYCSCTQRICR